MTIKLFAFFTALAPETRALRREWRRVCILCGLLGSGIASGAQAQSAEDSPAVLLEFFWPPGLEASVTSVRTYTRTIEKRSSNTATSRFKFRVESNGDSLRIRFAEPSVEFDGEFGGLPAEARAQIVAQFSNLMPDYFVTTAGEFAGIYDLQAYQARFKEYLVTTLPRDSDPNLTDRLTALVASEAFLLSKTAEQWNTLVGLWVDAEFVFGEAITYESEEPLPLVPGETVLMHYSFSANRMVPCSRSGVDRDCVELEMRSTADSEDMQRMIESLLSRVAGDASLQLPTFQTLEIENVIRLVTEADGLVPHACTTTKTVRGTVAAVGKTQALEQIDSTEESFVYP